MNPWEGEVLARPENKTRWIPVATELGLIGSVSAESQALIKAKNPKRYADGLSINGDLYRITQNLNQETARNEVMLHVQLHQWLSTSRFAGDLEAFNRQVYDTLFLTPKNDAWLGLMPEGVFSGLDQDGVVSDN